MLRDDTFLIFALLYYVLLALLALIFILRPSLYCVALCYKNSVKLSSFIKYGFCLL